MINATPISLDRFSAALLFAARQHGVATKKGQPEIPFFHHCLEVAHTLIRIAKIRDATTLIAALLHDTIEHADTDPQAIRERFGEDVLAIVQEVSDDKHQPTEIRRKRQLAQIPQLSHPARLIRLADKFCNLLDRVQHPPPQWSAADLQTYCKWSRSAVAALRGSNSALEQAYEQRYRKLLDPQSGENFIAG